MNDASSPSVPNDLRTPVQFLKGVGPERAQFLHRLGLHVARDLLFFFPRDYIDLSQRRTVAQLEDGELATVVGTVVEVEGRTLSSGRSMLGVLIQQDRDYLRAVWFNQPFLQPQFRAGQTIQVSGKVRLRGLRWEMSHPRHRILDEQSPDETGEFVGEVLPVYPLTEGLRQHQIRRIVRRVVDQHVGLVPEVFPQEFLAAKNLCTIETALREVHLPESPERLAAARHRLIYQELLVMQLALAWRQQQLHHEQQAISLPVTARIDARIRRLFPFPFTADQDRVIEEICTDLAQTRTMNRLLQGDVGSGKTAVAAYAMLLAIAHGHQAALMAPTEVLARQHYETLGGVLAKSQVRIGYLSGALSPSQRKELLQDIAAGNIDLVIGTHAVVSEGVSFRRLAVVVIDEQHKFGVQQRAALRQHDTSPHCLVMTATPIPRSVAMTLFGDLDLSEVREMPPGRQPVHTYLADESQRERWWQFFRKKLSEGRQGYVISPVVDDQSDELVGAEAALEHLANGELADFRLDLLHGRLAPREKWQVIEDFRQGKTQVLVATTVVEVGIDVPNANLMTIEHGERFGLAQLHQLRGRVGRGDFSGFVCVFSDTDVPETRERLQAFADTNDGFELAELDFQFRGPGELLGTRQHGMPAMFVADLRRDQAILQQARRDALDLMARYPLLNDPTWERLRRMVLSRYADSMNLSDVG